MRDIEIGVSFTPCRILEMKVIKATEIKMSCGGGMGGSCWEEYTRSKFNLTEDNTNNFIKLNTDRAKNRVLNKNYIVATKPVQIAKVSVLNTGNENIGDIGDVITRYYVVSASDKITFKREYMSYRESEELEDLSVENEKF